MENQDNRDLILVNIGRCLQRIEDLIEMAHLDFVTGVVIRILKDAHMLMINDVLKSYTDALEIAKSISAVYCTRIKPNQYVLHGKHTDVRYLC
jgi:hypothetical protein